VSGPWPEIRTHTIRLAEGISIRAEFPATEDPKIRAAIVAKIAEVADPLKGLSLEEMLEELKRSRLERFVRALKKDEDAPPEG